jgi:hypothetical protein
LKGLLNCCIVFVGNELIEETKKFKKASKKENIVGF